MCDIPYVLLDFGISDNLRRALQVCNASFGQCLVPPKANSHVSETAHVMN